MKTKILLARIKQRQHTLEIKLQLIPDVTFIT